MKGRNMPLGKRQQQLGNLTKDDINFPKHLTPEVVHTALYIHNADSKEEVINYIERYIKRYTQMS